MDKKEKDPQKGVEYEDMAQNNNGCEAPKSVSANRSATPELSKTIPCVSSKEKLPRLLYTSQKDLKFYNKRRVSSTPKKRSSSYTPIMSFYSAAHSKTISFKRKSFPSVWDVETPYAPIPMEVEGCSGPRATLEHHAENEIQQLHSHGIHSQSERLAKSLSNYSRDSTPHGWTSMREFIGLEEQLVNEPTLFKIVVSDDQGTTSREEIITIAHELSSTPAITTAARRHCVLDMSLQESSLNTSFQFCRICHENSTKEVLISPCNCSGSLAMVHKSCLERWLSSNKDGKCEICLFKFKLFAQQRSFIEYLKQRDDMEARRSLLSDIMCFLFLTPLVVLSAYFCLSGAYFLVKESSKVDWTIQEDGYDQEFRYATESLNFTEDIDPSVKKYLLEGQKFKNNGLWQSSGLILLSVILLLIYFPWMFISLSYQYKNWVRWRSTHRRVVLLDTETLEITPTL